MLIIWSYKITEKRYRIILRLGIGCTNNCVEMPNWQKKPMDKQKMFEILSTRIDDMESKPKTDGYEYEKSFIEFM
jgi:hypothetical protein